MKKSIIAVIILLFAGLACNLNFSEEVDSVTSDYGRFSSCIEVKLTSTMNELIDHPELYNDQILPECLEQFPEDQHDDLIDFDRECRQTFQCSADEFSMTNTQAAVTATEQALETQMAVATAEAAQAAGSQEDPDPQGNPAPANGGEDPEEDDPENSSGTTSGSPDLAAFCEIYQEMLDDNARRVEEYIDAITVEGSDLPDQIAVEADLALDAYFDRLAGPAPDEIRPSVEAIAAGSLLGLLSSPDGVPELEGHLEIVSNYANENCELILPEPEE